MSNTIQTSNVYAHFDIDADGQSVFENNMITTKPSSKELKIIIDMRIYE